MTGYDHNLQPTHNVHGLADLCSDLISARRQSLRIAHSLQRPPLEEGFSRCSCLALVGVEESVRTERVVVHDVVYLSATAERSALRARCITTHSSGSSYKTTVADGEVIRRISTRMPDSASTIPSPRKEGSRARRASAETVRSRVSGAS